MVENIFLLREAGTMLFGVNIREVDRMSLSPDKLSLYTRLDLRVDFPTGLSANISWQSRNKQGRLSSGALPLSLCLKTDLRLALGYGDSRAAAPLI